MPTLDDLLERERLRSAPPSPGMQRAIEETCAAIDAAFSRTRRVKAHLSDTHTPASGALKIEEADRDA